jgi:hypothetical protein
VSNEGRLCRSIYDVAKKGAASPAKREDAVQGSSSARLYEHGSSLEEKAAMNRVGKLATALVAGLVFAMASFASLAASEFEGTWAVKNT